MKPKGAIGWIAFVLVVVGGLNWGLVGFFSFDLVTSIFGASWVAKVVYDLVGLSALYMIFASMKSPQSMM